jgi:hypothetical protein
MLRLVAGASAQPAPPARLPAITLQGSSSALATAALALFCARLKLSKAKTRAYSWGSSSLTSQGEVRKDLRPLRGGRGVGVWGVGGVGCAGAGEALLVGTRRGQVMGGWRVPAPLPRGNDRGRQRSSIA